MLTLELNSNVFKIPGQLPAWKWKSLSRVQLFVTPWTVCDPMDYTVHGILQARILEWVAFPFSRGSSQPRSPKFQADSLPAEHKGSPRILEWVAYPFSSRSSQLRNWTRVSCIAGRFFTSWAKGKPKNTGVGGLSLLQQIFPTQELNWVSCIAGWFFTNWHIREAPCLVLVSLFLLCK